METLIEIKNVTKVFKEKKKEAIAIRNVSCTVNKGEMVALLGENGAGKTTLLRMMATLLSPTSGQIMMNGYDTVEQPTAIRQKLGVLFGGETGLYERLTARENLAYFASLYGMNKKEIHTRIEQLSVRFGMDPFLDRRVGKFSKGMRQKVAIARALIHNPDVVLFDEPTTGLDITSANVFRELLKELQQEGKTIVFSSHIMEEVKTLCESVIIIHKGQLIYRGNLQMLYQQEGTDDLNAIFMSKLAQGGTEIC